jgi:hypothetical protein
VEVEVNGWDMMDRDPFSPRPFNRGHSGSQPAYTLHLTVPRPRENAAGDSQCAFAIGQWRDPPRSKMATYSPILRSRVATPLTLPSRKTNAKRFCFDSPANAAAAAGLASSAA